MIRKPFAVYGAGGHSRVVAAILRALELTVYGYYDDAFTGSEMILGSPVRGLFADIDQARPACANAALALGDNQKRMQAFERLDELGFTLPSLVHPSALIEPDADVGPGTVICLGAKLCTQAVVGRGVILNTGASVDHESSIGDFVHLAPGAVVAGRTKIGERTFVGMNACIADGLTIGSRAIIGAGSIVLADVPSGMKVLGVHH